MSTLVGRPEPACEYLEYGSKPTPLSVLGLKLCAEMMELTSMTELRDDLRARFSSLRLRSRASFSSLRTSTCSTIIPFSRSVTSRE